MEIKIIEGDITKIKAGAIVNAANNSLLGPSFAKATEGEGGVDGAIHRAAGAGLLEECRRLGGCATGEAKITQGYNLAAKYVIHTVGPIYRQEGGKELSFAETSFFVKTTKDESEGKAELLANCYKNCLKLAKENNIRSVAFPAISTGAYGYPKEEAAQIALKTIKDFCAKNPSSFDEIIFALFDSENFEIYQSIWKKTL